VDLPSTVYALDSTTIDLCLSVFPWARFRSTKAAVKMHTLLDLTLRYLRPVDLWRNNVTEKVFRSGSKKDGKW
jgi:hypothetical protein